MSSDKSLTTSTSPIVSETNPSIDQSDIHPQFYLYDDDEVDTSIQLPKRGSKNKQSASQQPQPNLTINVPRNSSRRPPSSNSTPITDPLSLTPVTSNSRDTSFKSLEEILKFPIESSHAYSYAHLSPNSLALRLNVLKRSLEILKDRPKLFKSINLENDEDHDNDRKLSFYSLNSNNSNSSFHENLSTLHPPPSNPLYKHTNNSAEYFNDNNKYKPQSNASNAALAALFRPSMKRSDSFPVNQLYGKNETPENTPSVSASSALKVPGKPFQSVHDSILNDDLKDIINILESDKENLSNHSEIASNLHDLSLSTNHTPANDQLQKHEMLKNKLLYALATPFVENSGLTANLLNNGTSTPTRAAASSSSFNGPMSAFPNSSNSNNRAFHSISSGKHALPQSVFTVDIDNPWSVKAANDLACLMFGVSKNMIRSLTLMDLIAPQFRTFVTERLTNYISRNLDLSSRSRRAKDTDEKVTNNNILFAGEIVAILRPADQSYAWTSLWAKRKGNLIICMFDQIPCDAFDVVISSAKNDIPEDSPSSTNSTVTSTSTAIMNDSYTIDSFNEIAGDLISSIDTSNLTHLSDVSVSLDKEVARHHHHRRTNSTYSQTTDYGSDGSFEDHADAHKKSQPHLQSHQAQENNEEDDDDDVLDYYVSQDVALSEKINRKRYFTLQFNEEEENIPCAITSNPLEINQDRYEIKLKIHTLPYIAGIFVISASNYNILSCNNAIAKNMFGRSSEELTEKSIDSLIPNFTSILKTGLEQNSIPIHLSPGMVLPEHFFRRYDAYLRHQEDPEGGDVEELFFKSHGIKGRHRDGNMIYVDVQTRASASDNLVVWITYSRSSRKSNITKELNKLSSTTSSIALTDTTRSNSMPGNSELTPEPVIPQSSAASPLEENENTESATLSTSRSDNGSKSKNIASWPSQLSLFTRNKQDVNYAPSRDEISRQNSTRKARNDSFGIPVSRLNYSVEKPHALTKLYDSKDASKLSRQVSRSVEPEEETSEPSKSSTSGTTSTESKAEEYKTFAEEEILKIESDFLEEKMNASTHWPRTVGTMRRTKKFSEFKVIKDMGEGAYGKVVLAQHLEDEEYKIIIKCIDKERILVDTWVRDRNLGTIPSEIQVMAFLNNHPHPNIMKIVDFFEDSKYYYLETPIFGDPPAIDLFDYIEVKNDMTELECQFIFKQIASSIYHLHKNGIVHRDIKDENVIVDEHGIIKLIDFGSAGYTKQGPFDVFVGTIDYASPEVLKGQKYEGKPQDIWALGILLYTMLYKENPFYNVDEIMEGDLRIPFVVSEGSMKLIKKILVRDVSKRPTITDIVEDEWLRI